MRCLRRNTLTVIVSVQFLMIIGLMIHLRDLRYKEEERRDTGSSAEKSTDTGTMSEKKTKGCGDMIHVKDIIHKRRIPSAYIIGEIKCGTGALRKFLSMHPYLVVHEKDESNFLTSKVKLGEDAHAAIMPVSTQFQIGLENGPTYFNNNNAIKNVAASYKNETIMVILREPIERAVSHFVYYHMHFIKQDSEALKAFDKKVYKRGGHVDPTSDVVRHSMYVRAMKRWFQGLPKGRFEIVDGSAFIQNPFPVLKHLERALNLPSYFNESMFVFVKEKRFYCFKHDDGRQECLGSSKGSKHPQMSQETLASLREFFRPYNEELFELIGRRLSWG